MSSFIPDITEWFDILQGQDFAALRLKYSGNPEALYAIMQLECRKKASTKLPQLLANKDFRFPTVLSSEQCTSERLAEFHSTLVPKGVKLLDLTCGLGIDAFYFSKSCSGVVAVDIDSSVAETASHNAKAMGINNFTAICNDSEIFIRDLEDDSYSCIFIDPARRSGGKKVVFLKDCSPDVSSLIGEMLRVSPLVIIKASPMLDITAAQNELQSVSDVYTIGTPKECKELVLVCKRGYTDKAKTHAVTISSDFTHIYDFEYFSNQKAKYVSELKSNDYLYEPYPSVMKAGRFDELSHDFDTNALGRNTHIFTSPELKPNFPGKKMRILWAAPFNKRTAEYVKGTYPKTNVSTRGFVMSAPQLAKYVGIHEGGDLMLYGLGLDGKRNHWIAICDLVQN